MRMQLKEIHNIINGYNYGHNKKYNVIVILLALVNTKTYSFDWGELSNN